MNAEVIQQTPGGNPSRRGFRKAFPLGAPHALMVPLEGLLDLARSLAKAERAALFVVEGRDVTLVAVRGEAPAPQSRIAARALAHGIALNECRNGRYLRAVPMADAQATGSERRRLKPRSTLTSACLVLEGAGDAPAAALEAQALGALTRALLGALEARNFADAIATDRSTGALSRPAFERAAANEIAIAASGERPAALVLVEVVPRHPVVDLEAAEEAMTVAARALRQALRTTDLVGRRGPDELAALLVDAEPRSLPATVARLQQTLADALAGLDRQPPVLGASCFPDHGSSLDEIDAAALDALEGARAAGPGTGRVHDPALGRSPTACRKSFFSGDPGLDARKAALLFESVLAANAAARLEDALDAVLRALLAATAADRAAVLSGDGANLEPQAARDHQWKTLEPPVRFSKSACLRALALGRAVFVPDTGSATPSISPSAFELRLRSVVAVPLLGRDGPLGVLYADSLRPSARSFGAEELAYLEALAAQAALAIENAGLRQRLEEENEALKRAARGGADPTMLLGTSSAFRQALTHLPEIVESDAAVLILGESGTGKELLARKLHDLSARSRGTFVAQNCAAIPGELLESELFGHTAGAFSGASRAKRGLLELADGGSFFLDEVGDLPLALQAKLLRVLEDKEVRRIGETRAQRIDFRLLCATNRDLLRDVEEGRFRRDLLYRLNVFTVTLPPLSARREDIPELARHFIARAAARLGRPQPRLSPQALEILIQSPWPGNIRELANVLEKAVALARQGTIEPSHVGLEEVAGEGAARGPLRGVLARLERDLVADALRRHDGNVSATARALGIARQQVQRLMRKYRLKGSRQSTVDS